MCIRALYIAEKGPTVSPLCGRHYCVRGVYCTALMATERSRTPSVYQPCRVVEGPVNRRFENRGAVMERSLRETGCVFSGLRLGVNEVLAILGYYATLIASYRRFGISHLSNLQVTRSAYLPTFRNSLLVPSSGLKQSKCSCYRLFGTDRL